MNQDSSASWHQTLQNDPMLAPGDDNFPGFFQLGIDFDGFDETQISQNGYDPPMGDLGMHELVMENSMNGLHASGSLPNPSNEAVTPATLMRLQNPVESPYALAQSTDCAASTNNDFMDDLMLPESAASNIMSPLMTGNGDPSVEGETTPTMSAKTPKLSATSTPRTSAQRAHGKPTSADTAHKRTGSQSGHVGKPRQGGVPSHVSPAIRPKISPNISPLISQSPSTSRQHSISAETSALYLASKSNYQNILDGTHIPGVSYPEALAENLSSKRTSHKLAEQGRRNRINVALKEMESLLPPTPALKAKRDKPGTTEGDTPPMPAMKGKRDRPGAGDCDTGDKSSAFNNSKASTVELAIAYIKVLQTELAEAKARLSEMDSVLAKPNGKDTQTSEPSI